MEVWGVMTGVAEEQKIRYFASSKEKAKRIAYLKNYLYNDENAFLVKLDIDTYDEKMPPLIVFNGNLEYEADKDKDGEIPFSFYIYKFEPDEPGYKKMKNVGIRFEEPHSSRHTWLKNIFFHTYPFIGCVATIDGESPKALERRIKDFVFEEFCKKREELNEQIR